MFGHELIRINELIKTAKRSFKKLRGARFFFMAASASKLLKLNISSASERAFPGFGAIFLAAQLPPKRGDLVHKNSLASCQRCRHSVEPRALTCPFKQSNLSAGSCQNLKKCAAGQIVYETKCAAGKTYQTKCAAGQIF